MNLSYVFTSFFIVAIYFHCASSQDVTDTLGAQASLSVMQNPHALGPTAGDTLALVDGIILECHDSSHDPPDTIIADKLLPVKQFQPEYPEDARKAGITGDVWVKLLIGKDGSVIKAAIAKTDNRALSKASLVAALKWRFSPAMINGQPIVVWTWAPFRFRINQ